MIKKVLLSLFLISIFSGCDIRKKELELEKKIAEVNEKEQQLTLREQSLDLREAELNERQKKIDSTTLKNLEDSLYAKLPDLPGLWNVKMECTETNCPGSAVGDIKNEQWDIKFKYNNIIASAISANKLVRVYTGSLKNDVIELNVQSDSTTINDTKMNIRLQLPADKKEKLMTGMREIIQPSGCRILYNLQLKKQ